jgi:hypothetical protein
VHEVDSVVILENVPLQDRDLLGRLNQYFANLDARLRDGQGWLIFNGDRQRASRMNQFIVGRLAEQRPFVSYYHVPWRDFALNAYMMHVELPGHTPESTSELPATPLEREYSLAGRVSESQFFQMRYTDVLVVTGVRPARFHEAAHLASVVDERYRVRRPTILVIPGSPAEAAEAFRAVDSTGTCWQTIYDQMYKSSLLAL